MRLIMLGAPGSGKGTISKMLVEKYNIVQISTGDILRGAVAAGSPVGKQADAYMKRGDLVPDGVIMGIMEERLREADCAPGFILDGFPRTIPQAEALGGLLKKLSLGLDAVCNLDVPEDVIIRRLTGRRTCTNPSCQAIYNLDGKAPKKEGVCDRCGGALAQRDDEKEDVVRARLKTYVEKTEPLIGYYENEGLVLTVAGSESRLLFDQMVAKLGK
ncbi:MAG: adenylate kinase [Spirochaetes bacterium]|jgi:adenylate kinase|nr:adenylate kinase [Spirochaetota bacterium]